MTEEQDQAKPAANDWREQARREKERLAEELDKQPEGGEGEGGEFGEMPEANFTQFISSLAMQVMMFLGQIENPMVGKRILDLGAAKYNIDILGVLAEKTKGNLTKEEEQALTRLLSELRMGYVQTVKALEKAMAEAPPQAGGSGPLQGPGAQPPPPKGKIII
jgi:phospholipase/lecithinase/hemolysin